MTWVFGMFGVGVLTLLAIFVFPQMLLVGYDFVMRLRGVKNSGTVNKVAPPTPAVSRSRDIFDDLVWNGLFKSPSARAACPVTGCRITKAHSHVDALLDKLKRQ